MKLHTIQAQIDKAIRDVQIEISAMEPGQRTQFNEDKEELTAELSLLQRMAKMIDDYIMERSRIVINRMAQDREGI